MPNPIAMKIKDRVPARQEQNTQDNAHVAAEGIHESRIMAPPPFQLKGDDSWGESLDEIAEEPAQLHKKGAADAPVEPPPADGLNGNGMPTQLKTGIESMSGVDMSDVKVHYNSDKPAQLQAHAYAQGSDIHVAKGQEKHVAHEAWHVVQQKQGRVQPTTQLKGMGVNTEKSLETEADVMGAKAMETGKGLGNTATPTQLKAVEGAGVAQLKPTLTDSWEDLQDKSKVEGHVVGNSFRDLAKRERALRGAFGVQTDNNGGLKSGSPNLAIPELRVMALNTDENKVYQVAAHVAAKGSGEYLIFKSTGDQKLVTRGNNGPEKIKAHYRESHNVDEVFSPVGSYSFYDANKHGAYSVYKARHDNEYMQAMEASGDHQKFHHSEQAIYKMLFEQPELALQAIDKGFKAGKYQLLAISLDIFTTRASCGNCGKGADHVVDDKEHFFGKVKTLIGDGKLVGNKQVAFHDSYRGMVRFAADYDHDSTQDHSTHGQNQNVLHAPAQKNKNIAAQQGVDPVNKVTIFADTTWAHAPLSSPPSAYKTYQREANMMGLNMSRGNIINKLYNGWDQETPEEKFKHVAFAYAKSNDNPDRGNASKRTKKYKENKFPSIYRDALIAFLYEQKNLIGCTDDQIEVWALKHYKAFGNDAAKAEQRMWNYHYDKNRWNSNREGRTNTAVKALRYALQNDIADNLLAWLKEDPPRIEEAEKFAVERNAPGAFDQAMAAYIAEVSEAADQILRNRVREPEAETKRQIEVALQLKPVKTAQPPNNNVPLPPVDYHGIKLKLASALKLENQEKIIVNELQKPNADVNLAFRWCGARSLMSSLYFYADLEINGASTNAFEALLASPQQRKTLEIAELHLVKALALLEKLKDDPNCTKYTKPNLANRPDNESVQQNLLNAYSTKKTSLEDSLRMIRGVLRPETIDLSVLDNNSQDPPNDSDNDDNNNDNNQSKKKKKKHHHFNNNNNSQSQSTGSQYGGQQYQQQYGTMPPPKLFGSPQINLNSVRPPQYPLDNDDNNEEIKEDINMKTTKKIKTEQHHPPFNVFMLAQPQDWQIYSQVQPKLQPYFANDEIMGAVLSGKPSVDNLFNQAKKMQQQINNNSNNNNNNNGGSLFGKFWG